MTELTPIFDKAQSFYNKAYIELGDDNKLRLYSYGTLVAECDRNHDNKCKVFDTYSATTLRHIKEFLKQCSQPAISKAQIERDYM